MIPFLTIQDEGNPFLTIWGEVKHEPLFNYLGWSEALIPFLPIWGEAMITFCFHGRFSNRPGVIEAPSSGVQAANPEHGRPQCKSRAWSTTVQIQSVVNHSANPEHGWPRCKSRAWSTMVQIQVMADHGANPEHGWPQCKSRAWSTTVVTTRDCKHFLCLTLHSEALPSSYRKKWPQHKQYLFKGCTDLLET